MPVTIKELKEFLNKFPEDAEVRVLRHYDAGQYRGYDARFVDLKIDGWDTNIDFSDFTDLKSHPWVVDGKHDFLIGKKFLDFGEKE